MVVTELALGLITNFLYDSFKKFGEKYFDTESEAYYKAVKELNVKYKVDNEQINTFLYQENVKTAIKEDLKNPNKLNLSKTLTDKFLESFSDKNYSRNEANLILNTLFETLDDEIRKNDELREHLKLYLEKQTYQGVREISRGNQKIDKNLDMINDNKSGQTLNKDRCKNNIPIETEFEKRVAVIFTALPVEYNAVRSHLESVKERVHPQGTIYEQGSFSCNGRPWSVGIAEIGEGNEQAALEVERAIQYFNPRIILFVGVAGGVKDVKLGDVVVATKVYGYESGKAGETFKPRPEAGMPNYKLLNRAKAEAKKDDWLQRLGEFVPNPHPSVFIKPIAAGSKVINSTRSAVYDFIKSNYEDTLAVEMEGYGFLKAAYANPDVYALVIRGISDLIDGKETTDKTGSQKLASLHASAFAFEILAKTYIEPINTEESKHLYKLYSQVSEVAEIKKEIDLKINAIKKDLADQTIVDKFKDETGVYSRGSIFGTRITHFRYEKQALAKKAIHILEDELTTNKGMKYCILVDSGTTAYNLICAIVERVNELNNLSNSSEKYNFWTDRVLIVTNNIPGIQYINNHCGKGASEYTDLLIKCMLLPGKPLPYSADVVGSEAIRFLENGLKKLIKDELNVKNDNEYQILCFMVPYYIVRHPARVNGKELFCPVARGGGDGGHFDIKKAFAELSDKIYLISPLTRFSFATCNCFNKINGLYIDEQSHSIDAKAFPNKVMYRELQLTTDELVEKCNFIITNRKETDLFGYFARELLVKLKRSYGESKINIASYYIEEVIPIGRDNPNYKEKELEVEIPYDVLRKAYIKKKQSGKSFIWDFSWESQENENL